MTPPKNSFDIEKYRHLLASESDQILLHGSFHATVLGLFSGLLLLFLESNGFVSGFGVPAIWAIFCGLISLAIFVYLFRRNTTKREQIAIILIYLSLPFSLFVLAHYVLPSGAATFITGPATYLVMLMIILSGFLFEKWYSVACGLMAGILYFGFFLLGRPYFAVLHCEDPVMYQDLTSGSIYLFKSVMYLTAGVMVGVLAENTKKLVQKILTEEGEKQWVHRLFGEYVSPEVKNKILELGERRGGEKRRMAILFADIRGFSSLSETIPPDQLVHQLNRYLEAMGEVITRHGGVIDKYIGDAIMATFGGVLELERPASRAVAAATGMLEGVEALNADWRREGAAPLAIGIGLHYGEVVLGSIGGANRREFAVIGDTVNTASRIESQCKEQGCSLLVSEAIHALLSDEERGFFRPIGDIVLKGKQQAVPLFGRVSEGGD